MCRQILMNALPTFRAKLRAGKNPEEINALCEEVRDLLRQNRVIAT